MNTSMTTDRFHADHISWKGEIALWQDEVTCWENEQNRLLNEIRLATNIQKLRLEQHLRLIERHQNAIENHERLLAMYETPPVRPHHEVEARSAVSHDIEAAPLHAKLRQSHSQFQRRHREIIASLSAALEGVRSANAEKTTDVVVS